MLPSNFVIVDLEALAQPPELAADVCVIGAGAAGIILTVELIRLGKTVLLLEAGGLHPETATQHLYDSELTGLPHIGIHEGRFRTFGGTTTKWGGQILELDELDFERRPWVPESGWPIAKSELTPFYRRALEMEGVAPCILNDADVWRALHTGPPELGAGLEPFFTRWCPQPDFGKLYRSQLQQEPKAHVCLHANFYRFVFTPSGDAVTHAACRTLDGREFCFAAREFVLCAGAIETARLLLQPIPDRTTPWDRGGNLGRFFQDHIDIPVAKLSPVSPVKFHLWFDNAYLNGFRYVPKIKLSAKLQEEFGVLAVGASLHCQSVRQAAVEEFRETLLNVRRTGFRGLRGSQLLAAIKAADILTRKAWRLYRHKRAYNPDDLGIDLRVHCEQAPNADSRITLAEDRDALGLFKTRLDWRVGELELRTVRQFASYACRQFEACGIARAAIYKDYLATLTSFASHAVDTYHHMGTARMATSASRGVVDENCRIFGLQNAFLCGSAVFPTSGFSNPTHTILALGARLAQHLSGKP